LRVIPASADVRTLLNTHRSESFDPRGINEDPNIALPLDRMRELVQEGTIREISPRVASVMGSITAPGRFIRETAPAIARMLAEDRADAAVLVPL
jgi:D-proline reductase (dithiol) PrdB